MTLEAMLIFGGIAGLVIGLIAPRDGLGCLLLLAVPVAAFAYVWVWQAQHPENLRSTSALDFVFGALWPSIAAVCGYAAGRTARSLLWRRNPSDPSER
jgi:hypothetical protein